MFVCCECCVLSGRGLCDGLITRPEESYWLMRRCVWSRNLRNEEAMARVGPQRHRKKQAAVKLSTHFHLVARLRKIGAVPPLHLYDLMTCARKTATLLMIVTVIKLSQGCAVFVFALSFSLLRDLVVSHRCGVDVTHVRCP